jgi:dihydropteroate synthase
MCAQFMAEDDPSNSLSSRTPLIMGIVNVTPDSFSDGGRWLDPVAAIEHGKRLVDEGAHILDVGGESTRPGAAEVPVEEELARVIPVVEGLSEVICVSIDTKKPEVAEAAVRSGARIINDVSASLWQVAADCGAGWIAMHMKGDPATMQQQPTYDDVVAEVVDYLSDRAAKAMKAGVADVWIDPGIGFGKTLHHNLELMANLDALVATGFPVAFGASRKTFLGTLTAIAGEVPPATDRHDASLAAAVWAITKGAGIIRVHDVQATVRAAQLITAIQDLTKAEEQAA